MRTINVKPNLNIEEILDNVASVLENDIIVSEKAVQISCCVDYESKKISQYELDKQEEIVNEVVWSVDTQIKNNGLSYTVNLDC